MVIHRPKIVCVLLYYDFFHQIIEYIWIEFLIFSASPQECLSLSVSAFFLLAPFQVAGQGHPFWPDPYGPCGKPTMHVQHGGFELVEKSSFSRDNPNSGTRCPSYKSFWCEPAFYCDEGYTMNRTLLNNGKVPLKCLKNNSTYSWVGSLPTCDPDSSTFKLRYSM